MEMDSQFSNVLTEELLAAAERRCVAARAADAAATLYDGGSGACAGIEHGWSAKEMKKWLT